MTVCCPGFTIGEQIPHWHQVSRNSSYLLSPTENSSVQTAPWPMKKNKNKTKKLKQPFYLSFFFNVIKLLYLYCLVCLHESCYFLFIIIIVAVKRVVSYKYLRGPNQYKTWLVSLTPSSGRERADCSSWGDWLLQTDRRSAGACLLNALFFADVLRWWHRGWWGQQTQQAGTEVQLFGWATTGQSGGSGREEDKGEQNLG